MMTTAASPLWAQQPSHPAAERRRTFVAEAPRLCPKSRQARTGLDLSGTNYSGKSFRTYNSRACHSRSQISLRVVFRPHSCSDRRQNLELLFAHAFFWAGSLTAFIDSNVFASNALPNCLFLDAF